MLTYATGFVTNSSLGFSPLTFWLSWSGETIKFLCDWCKPSLREFTDKVSLRVGSVKLIGEKKSREVFTIFIWYVCNNHEIKLMRHTHMK